jgi:hypothetical protein
MSTKTTFKRIALVAVAAMGFGVLTSVAPASALANATPWTVTAAQTNAGGGTATTTATQIVGANNYVELTPNDDYLTVDAITVLVVAGSTITYTETAAGSIAGIVNSAATEVLYTAAPLALVSADMIAGNKVRISAATVGTITAKYYERAVLAGVPTDTLKQTVTITVSAVKTWSSRFSTSVIVGAGGTVAGVGETDILAPKGPLTGPFAGVATVTVTFNDSANAILALPTGTFPSVRAVFKNASDPGNLSWGANGGGNVGRDVTVITKAATQTLTIFQDGWNGTSTIDIYVDGTYWASETLSFYGEVTTVTPTQKLFVAPIAPVLGAAHGCGAISATCLGTTIALTPAVTLVATDSKGIKVPFLTFTATSSDTTVFASSSTVAETVATGTGSYNANVSSIPAGTSGKTALITWKTLQTNGTTVVDTAATPTTFAVGGSAASIAFTVNASGNAGAKGTFTIDKKDSAGNKSFDAAHSVNFKSNTAVTASIFDASSNTQTSGTSTQLIINGTKTWDFFNPLVDASVVFDVLVDSLLAGSQSFTVSTVSQAALDAAQEAIDAANAATDAANAAAEAADAATAAAQDAADAVAALSTQVSEMIAALRKQITALTNLVIKIQKKVRA